MPDRIFTGDAGTTNLHDPGNWLGGIPHAPDEFEDHPKYESVDEFIHGVDELFAELCRNDSLIAYMVARSKLRDVPEIASLKSIVIGLARNNRTLIRKLMIAELAKSCDHPKRTK